MLRIIIITLVIGALCGYFLANNNSMGFVATIIIGLVLLKISDKMSREVAYDERDKFIASQASYVTLIITMTSVAALVIASVFGDILNTPWFYNVTKDLVEKYAPFVLYVMAVYIAPWVIFKLRYS